jgi:isopentenyl diphosphate isomerase/L-lactate dehydrogenase-like FMN-dependent dehydrogenase
MIEIIRKEMIVAMALTGVTEIAKIDRRIVDAAASVGDAPFRQ